MTYTTIIGADDLVGSWVARRTQGRYVPGTGRAMGLVREREGTKNLVAGVLFDSWNGSSMCAHIAGEGWGWCQPDFLRLCFSYAFDQMKVKKLVGPVGSGNLAARRLDEHLGFVLEATLTGAHPDGDLLLFTMTREQCWMLNKPVRSRHEQAEGAKGT